MVLEALLSELPLVLLLAGAGLIIAEAFAPGAHFFVVGVALFAAGLVGFFLPVGGTLSLIIMTAVVLVTAVGTLYGYRKADLYGGEGEGKTSDSKSLRGKSGRVTERVTPTEGQVKLDEGGFNPYYQARSVDGEIAEGTEVIVVDPGGDNVLTVESYESLSDEIDRELERDRRTSERESETEASS
jgi:membrane protein implicated in regulation of membrane protease activity